MVAPFPGEEKISHLKRQLFDKEKICLEAGTINIDGNALGKYFLKINTEKR